MKWLKKLFKRKEPREITIDELKEELEKKETATKEDIKQEITNLNSIKKDTKTALETLSTADLQEKNPQILSRVSSNRDSYIQQTERLLDNIAVQAEDTQQSIARAAEAINDFAVRSEKSYQITQFLIGKELAAVSDKIKELTNKLRDIEEKQETLNRIKELQKKIENLKEYYKLKKKTTKEITALERTINKLQKEKQKKETEEKELRAGQEHKEYQKLKEQKEKLMNEKIKLKSEIINVFSPLQKALRKYSKISTEPEIINKYIEDPYTALLEDAGLEIIKALSKIDIRTLNMKEKEKKISAAIKTISKEKLQELKERDAQIKKEITETMKKISETDIIQRIEVKKKEIQTTEEQIKEKQTELARKKNYLAGIDEKKLKNEIAIEFKNITKENAIISWPSSAS